MHWPRSDNATRIALERTAGVARCRRCQPVRGYHRQHDRSRHRLVVGKLDQLALATGLQQQALGRRQRALQALARQLALGWPVVAQRHDELVGPETPIVRIWSVDV